MSRYFKQLPEAAITDLDQLKNIIILGFPVYLWDIENGHIRKKTIIKLDRDMMGTNIIFSQGQAVLQWCNIHDEHYKLARLPEYQYLLFNFREEAEAAKAQLDHSLKGLFE
jgi:hypothetical protein